MNVVLAFGATLWTVILVDKRNESLSALEKASVKQDIHDIAKFVAELESEIIDFISISG